MFCVVCGVETDEELRQGVCARCYLEKHPLVQVPDVVDIEVCVHCHARKRGELWLPGHEALDPVVDEAVRDAVAWEKVVRQPHLALRVAPEDERNFAVEIDARGVADGLPFEKRLATRSRIKNATCLRCSRIQGGYYEAVVQVRATRRDLDEAEMRAIRQLASRFIERVVSEGDRNAFVLRDEALHGGLDIYLGTTNAGRMLAKTLSLEHGGKITEHPKTVGQKDGLDLVRMTFSVRLPEYRQGDAVSLGDDLYEISHIGGKSVTMRDLRTGRVQHAERAQLDRAVVLDRAEAREAVVVSRAEGELQVLDPWTYQTVTVLRTPLLGEVGETVAVLRHDGELVPLPPRLTR